MTKTRQFPIRWLVAVVSLAAGEALGLIGWRFAPAWPLVLCVTPAVALVGWGMDWRGTFAFVTALLGLGLALRSEAQRGDVLGRSNYVQGPLAVEVTVGGEVSRRGDWVSFETSCRGVALEVVLPVGEGGAPRIGERWRVAGWLERRDRDDRRRRTLWVKGHATSAERIGCTRFAALRRMAVAVRRRLSRAIAVGLGERNPVTAIHRAMLLGERSHLPKREREIFIGAGTMHVFAISGLHVGVVALLIVIVLMMLLVPLRLVGVAMAPLLWFYVFLIGMPPSAVRAALMASCYFLAPLFWRRSDGLVAWSQAFLIVHLLDPGALLAVGSALSFAVMLTILLYDRWAAAAGLSGWVRALGFVFAVWAAGTPIAAHSFGRITPGGMLANLVVVPLASLTVVFGFLGSAVSLVLPDLGAHLNGAAALVTDLMRGISAVVASLPGANFETTPWTFAQCALWYLALAVGAVFRLKLFELRRLRL